MKTLTGSPAARVSTAQFPVDNVDQQTALSIEPAAQAALSGVARAYSELDGHNGRIAAIEINVAGAGAIDGRLDALELLTGSTGGIDARLDAVEGSSLTNIGKGAHRQTGAGGFNVPSGATSAAQDVPLTIDAVPGGFTDAGFWGAGADTLLVAPQAGRYLVTCVAFSALSVFTYRLLGTFAGTLTSAGAQSRVNTDTFDASVVLAMLAGDSVRLRAEQTSGSPAGITGRLSLVRIG